FRSSRCAGAHTGPTRRERSTGRLGTARVRRRLVRPPDAPRCGSCAHHRANRRARCARARTAGARSARRRAARAVVRARSLTAMNGAPLRARLFKLLFALLAITGATSCFADLTLEAEERENLGIQIETVKVIDVARQWPAAATVMDAAPLVASLAELRAAES